MICLFKYFAVLISFYLKENSFSIISNLVLVSCNYFYTLKCACLSIQKLMMMDVYECKFKICFFLFFLQLVFF